MSLSSRIVTRVFSGGTLKTAPRLRLMKSYSFLITFLGWMTFNHHFCVLKPLLAAGVPRTPSRTVWHEKRASPREPADLADALQASRRITAGRNRGAGG